MIRCVPFNLGNYNTCVRNGLDLGNEFYKIINSNGLNAILSEWVLCVNECLRKEEVGMLPLMH